MEKVEGTGRINASIECVFGYKVRVNRTFPNTSRLLEVIEREHIEPILSVKNSQELDSNLFPYIAPVIPRLFPREVVGGEYFVFADILKEVNLGYLFPNGVSSKALSRDR